MQYDYRLYSSLPSMYSGKVRGYMNYKQLNYHDKMVSAYDLAVTIKSKTGERVIPIVKTKTGEWLQDTTLIIEALERRHPEHPTTVETPTQYMISLLLECWGDEYWLPVAMHYRWSYEENHAFMHAELAGSMVPFAKSTLGLYLGKRVSRFLDSSAPVIGFAPAQHQAIENWTERTLDLLEAHFSTHDYLLGGRPTVADFSLLASFFGHLNRDPAPKRILMPKRPNLAAWVEKTHSGAPADGDLLDDDTVAATLSPILQQVFEEFVPMVEAYRDITKSHVRKNDLKSGDKIPRFLNLATFPMGENHFRRCVMPYTLWMMQRVQDAFYRMDVADQTKVDAWLNQAFGKTISGLDLGPQLLRDGLSTRLA